MNHVRQPENIAVTEWSEFELALARIRKELSTRQATGGLKFDDTLFRGHGNSTWKLAPTLETNHPMERSLVKYYRKASAAKSHIETLSGKRWDKLPAFWEFERRLKDSPAGFLEVMLSHEPEVYEYLVYLRHHGFPSPLLDWTASPYVAAFFAFDDIDARANMVSVHAALRGPTSVGSASEQYHFVGPYMRTDQRHVLQQSQYSWCMGFDTASDGYAFMPHEEAIYDGVGSQGEVFKITIPVGERISALRDLDQMNINAFSLFGSEDSLVRTIARRECEFKDWSL